MNKSKISSAFTKDTVIKIINVLLILAIGGIGYWFYTGSRNKTAVASKQNNNVSTISSTPQVKKLVIDISGAVNKPGVYEFDTDDRVVDAIERAGGFNEKADMPQIEKTINKAQKLSDGIKIYIPFIGEITANNLAPSNVTLPTGVVNINSANKQQLVELPEIGEVTADKIIASRPYSSIEELMTKGVLRQSSFEKIKSRLSI